MSEFSQVTVDRSYWDRRPCNIRHSPKWVRANTSMKLKHGNISLSQHIPRFAQFERWRGKKVLEIGCGIGTDTVNFACNGALVTAVDLSPQSLDLAR
jgi:2-polyprenyl-3-methyl-5-hydroxy-6-metoxy-1,4-benzoquinol methylase